MFISDEVSQPEEFAYKMVFWRGGYVSPICTHCWAPGRNVSSRKSKELQDYEQSHRMAGRGFHVFHTPYSSMAAFVGIANHVLKLRVRPEHHVSSGRFMSYPTSVYTEVENLGPYTGNA